MEMGSNRPVKMPDNLPKAPKPQIVRPNAEDDPGQGAVYAYAEDEVDVGDVPPAPRFPHGGHSPLSGRGATS
jgi:hypothetical protein